MPPEDRRSTVAGLLGEVDADRRQRCACFDGAELRAHTPVDMAVPSADTADQTVQVVVSGRRHTVNVNTAQATGSGSSASLKVPDPLAESGFWTRSVESARSSLGGHNRWRGGRGHCDHPLSGDSGSGFPVRPPCSSTRSAVTAPPMTLFVYSGLASAKRRSK